jgi:hypothetical protein
MSLDFSDGSQAENLKAAAIGKDRSGPINETVQTARRADDFQAGPNIQVIGIAQDDLGAHLAKFARVNGFDAALRPDRHKDWRVNNAVGSCQAAQARFRGGIRLK